MYLQRQTLASDCVRRALQPRTYLPYGALAPHHDEISFDVPDALPSEVAEEMVQIMVEQMRAASPGVTHEADPSLMRRWADGP